MILVDGRDKSFEQQKRAKSCSFLMFKKVELNAANCSWEIFNIANVAHSCYIHN